MKSSTDLILRDLGYDAISTIGEGTFSKVKLANSRNYCRKVAIKVMDTKQMSDSYPTRFLKRELDILKCVDHPHIINVFELYEMRNGLIFIVMELCAMDLLQLIGSTGRLTDEKAKGIFHQITSAIAYLHSKNIVHRDLKCENILLTENHCVKITDFGFGKMCSEGINRCRTYCGTTAYMSPEVLMNISYEPKKYDIWCLGVILYGMVTASLPFSTSNVLKQLQSQQRGVVFPDDMSLDAKCKALITEILTYNANERPNIRRILQQGWL